MTTTRTTVVALTAGLIALTGAAAAPADAAGSSHYAHARAAWRHGASVSSAEQNRYLDHAEHSLRVAGGYSRQVGLLQELIDTPLTSLTHPQKVRVHRVVTVLDRFFDTPGLYR